MILFPITALVFFNAEKQMSAISLSHCCLSSMINGHALTTLDGKQITHLEIIAYVHLLGTLLR